MAVEGLTVMTTGCFDLFHVGHAHVLGRCRSYADGGEVIVALDSDERVRVLKGAGRPVYSFDERHKILRSVKGVTDVVSFTHDDELERLIMSRAPQVFVKGEDWRGKQLVGAEYLRRVKCDIKYVPIIYGVSTSRIMERIQGGTRNGHD